MDLLMQLEKKYNMIHTDNRWKCSQEHIEHLKEYALTAGSFDRAIVYAWLLGSSSNKKRLEEKFLFLSDEDNFVSKEEFNN